MPKSIPISPPKLHKVAGWGQQDDAVAFYRIVQPMRFLKREGLVEETRIIPFTGQNQADNTPWNDRTFMSLAEGADAFMTTLLWKQRDILRMLNIRKHFNLKWIVDTDDNMYAVHHENPAYAYTDDLNANRAKCLYLADGVTVSVPNLAKVYSTLNKHIFVQPNGLDFALWDDLKVAPHKGIRIGWDGSMGHNPDLDLIRPVITELKKKYPEVVFVTMGWQPDFSDEHQKWVPMMAYPKKLASLGLDIGLAPLIDSSFNRCKSNLRWLNYAALSIPVVYSPVENQKNLPGMKATSHYEWFDALDTLVADKALRRKLGTGQNRYAKEHFDMKHNVDGLATWIAALERSDRY